MADSERLASLLDDPAVRVVVFGLAHSRAAAPSIQPGAPRLLAVVRGLADTTDAVQYHDWTAGHTAQGSMSSGQARALLGDDVIDEVSVFSGSMPDETTAQLADLLPQLVAAVHQGGDIVDSAELDEQLHAAIAADDQSAGPFGPQAH
jgi:hypothetical protein